MKKMKKISNPTYWAGKLTALIICVIFLSIGKIGVSQNVGINQLNPDPSAILDITATDMGLLIPRVALNDVNTAAPVTTPAEGLLIYNETGTEAHGFYYWDGSMWIQALGPQGPIGLTGATGAVGPQGPIGLTGATGPQGIQGIPGPVGCGLANYVVKSNGASAVCSQIYDNGTNVGIGMTTPSQQLVVNRGGIFNESGGNYDFRIESDGQTDMFFVDASTNRIGINTTAPAAPIHFITTNEDIWLTQWDNTHASLGAAGRFQHTNAGNGSRVLMGASSYSGTAFASTGLIGLSLSTNSGCEGYGAYGSSNTYEGTGVVGSRFDDGGADLGFGGLFLNDLGYTGVLLSLSDKRLKKNIKSIENATDLLLKLKPVYYNYKTEQYPNFGLNEEIEFGFIAQDVEAIIPNIVRDKKFDTNSCSEKSSDFTEKKSSELFKTINYIQLIPILTQAIKEQQAIIEKLEKRIEVLENN